MRRVLTAVGTLLLLLAFTAVRADATPPDQLVRDTSTRITDLIKKNRAEYSANHQKLYAMVDQEVLPHFDFKAMAKQVLGRYWKDANPEQQERFVKEFRDLLVRTYATALLKYNDEEIRTLPFHAGAEDKTALVRTEVVQGGGQNVPINYSFFRSDSGWKVYDVSVAGVSLVTNYRATYAEKVRAQGLDALIESITAANRRGQVDVKAPGV